MSSLKTVIDSVPGFKVAGVACGLKKHTQLDLALIVSDQPCTVAGVFTRNAVKAAPLHICMDRLARNPNGIHALVINTGSANAMTGEQGLQDAQETTQIAAQALGLHADDVLVLSTGVIGQRLKMDKIASGIQAAAADLGNNWHRAASAIMTTDTMPKTVSICVQHPSGATYTIAGIAKGAGMIAPNMGTMLSVIVTDAALTVEQANHVLHHATDATFNRIVIDGDTSTNDAVLLMANGVSGITIDTPDALAQFETAFTQICRYLAHWIVRDGEGVTKFITVRVDGAPDDNAARQIAYTIATSPLVKTAFYGNDANWGRIVAAAGRAGIPIDQNKIRLYIAPGVDTTENYLLLVENGTPTDYDEAHATRIIEQSDVTVTLELGLGHGTATIWTTDFSHDYVSINADYRT